MHGLCTTTSSPTLLDTTPTWALILCPLWYKHLPILHLLSVHPGLQTQVFGLSQTPFSQGGAQIAKERAQQMHVNFCESVSYYSRLVHWLLNSCICA